MMERKDVDDSQVSIQNMDDLKARIADLESLQDMQEEDLKDGFQDLKESFSSSRIITNLVSDISQSFPVKQNLLKIALGLTAGFLTRRMPVVNAISDRKILRKALGSAIILGIVKLIQKKKGRSHSDTLFAKIQSLLGRLFVK